METPLLEDSIAKLAIAGEQDGFTVEQMIGMLNAGVTIEGLLRIIEFRRAHPFPALPWVLGVLQSTGRTPQSLMRLGKLGQRA